MDFEPFFFVSRGQSGDGRNQEINKENFCYNKLPIICTFTEDGVFAKLWIFQYCTTSWLYPASTTSWHGKFYMIFCRFFPVCSLYLYCNQKQFDPGFFPVINHTPCSYQFLVSRFLNYLWPSSIPGRFPLNHQFHSLHFLMSACIQGN